MPVTGRCLGSCCLPVGSYGLRSRVPSGKSSWPGLGWPITAVEGSRGPTWGPCSGLESPCQGRRWHSGQTGVRCEQGLPVQSRAPGSGRLLWGAEEVRPWPLPSPFLWVGGFLGRCAEAWERGFPEGPRHARARAALSSPLLCFLLLEAGGVEALQNRAAPVVGGLPRPCSQLGDL